MAEIDATGGRPKTDFDDWRTIVLSLYMTLVGYGVLVAIPVINTAWVQLLGFSESQVGYVTSADQGGLALGAVITALIIGRFNRRHLFVFSVALSIGANYLCTLYHSYEAVLYLRIIAGIGSGIYTATAVASLGATQRPALAYNMMLFAFAFSQFAEIRILPQLSMNGIYWFFIICYAVSVPFIKYVVPRARTTEEATMPDRSDGIPPLIPWLGLAAIVATYINIGAYWAYIELAALNDGIAEEWSGSVLAWASLLSVVGCAGAYLACKKFGLAKPLMTALVVMTINVGFLAAGITDLRLLVSVFMFNFLWIFIDVYQMSTIALVDPKGAFSSLMPGAQGIGYIVGPSMAAFILSQNPGWYSGIFMFCATFAAIGLFIYATMYIRLHNANPQLLHTS